MNLIYNNKTPVGINYNSNEIETLNYNEEPVWENTPYEELEYIKGTGTQYIDTGFIPTDNTKIKLKIKDITTNDKMIISATSDWSSNRFLLTYYSNALRWYLHGEVYKRVDTNSINEVEAYRGYYKVNDEVISNDTTSKTLTNLTNIFIWGSSYLENRNNGFKLYYFQIYDNEVLIRDFIPVRRKSDGEVCLYDKVSKQFYINQGTGKFSAGPEKQPKISDFKILEYIQSTGTQCIDTGINPDSNTVIEIKFSWQGSNYGWGRLFGTSGDINFELAAKSNTTFRFGINGIGADVPFNGDVIQTVKVTGTGKYYLDDVLKLDRNINQNFITFLYLLCIGNASNREKGKAKIYYCKIWNNDILIKNFIPVEKKSNNEIGLYNLVDNSFYTNQGTGEFIAGEEI